MSIVETMRKVVLHTTLLFLLMFIYIMSIYPFGKKDTMNYCKRCDHF